MHEILSHVSDYAAEFIAGTAVLVWRKIEKRMLEKRLRKELEEKVKKELEENNN